MEEEYGGRKGLRVGCQACRFILANVISGASTKNEGIDKRCPDLADLMFSGNCWPVGLPDAPMIAIAKLRGLAVARRAREVIGLKRAP